MWFHTISCGIGYVPRYWDELSEISKTTKNFKGYFVGCRICAAWVVKSIHSNFPFVVTKMCCNIPYATISFYFSTIIHGNSKLKEFMYQTMINVFWKYSFEVLKSAFVFTNTFEDKHIIILVGIFFMMKLH